MQRFLLLARGSQQRQGHRRTFRPQSTAENKKPQCWKGDWLEDVTSAITIPHDRQVPGVTVSSSPHLRILCSPNSVSPSFPSVTVLSILPAPTSQTTCLPHFYSQLFIWACRSMSNLMAIHGHSRWPALLHLRLCMPGPTFRPFEPKILPLWPLRASSGMRRRYPLSTGFITIGTEIMLVSLPALPVLHLDGAHTLCPLCESVPSCALRIHVL